MVLDFHGYRYISPREMYVLVTHVNVSVCPCLCVSVSFCPTYAFLHYFTDPNVTLENGMWCPLVACALLSEFAVGARVSLLWQQARLMRNVSEDGSTRCMGSFTRSPAVAEGPRDAL